MRQCWMCYTGSYFKTIVAGYIFYVFYRSGVSPSVTAEEATTLPLPPTMLPLPLPPPVAGLWNEIS